MFWKQWVDLNRENESWALVSHDHKNLMLECPHGCMHDQFCIKFPNHHCCMCVMEIMWDIPFIPEPLAKPTLWHISCPAVLQALSQNPFLSLPISISSMTSSLPIHLISPSCPILFIPVIFSMRIIRWSYLSSSLYIFNLKVSKCNLIYPKWYVKSKTNIWKKWVRKRRWRRK